MPKPAYLLILANRAPKRKIGDEEETGNEEETEEKEEIDDERSTTSASVASMWRLPLIQLIVQLSLTDSGS